MKVASIEIVDFGDCGDGAAVVVECESIHESIHPPSELIHQRWVSSAEAKHRLRVKNQAEFVRAIAKLTDEHKIPHSVLRRGSARSTEYSEFAIALVRALPNEQAFNQLKREYFGSTEQVSITAPLKFKENANNQLATSNSQIAGLQQQAQLKLQQLHELCGQWQEAEKAEKLAQQKDQEAQQAQWDLECIDEVMREQTYKKTRKREIREMLNQGKV
ncbi:hypothetical protein QUA71_06900 [Microcoleus sp. MON1_C5]|uniref:hypothetical protein n=1 Tax=Microcoleus sp. MON1_C5 TaxID=2818828 RepID=UPI002FD34955